MGFELTEEQKMIQETARKFVANKIEPIARSITGKKSTPGPRGKNLLTLNNQTVNLINQLVSMSNRRQK